MAPVRLPEIGDGEILRTPDPYTGRLMVELILGKHAGCTAFRAKDGRVEVSTVMSPISRSRGGSKAWGLQVVRRGLVMWWPLDGTVWLNV